jgi:type IV pilus assembly protein PilM
MQEGAEPVEKGAVTGPALAIPGFVETLSEQPQLPLQPAVLRAEDQDVDAARLTVAAGLAADEIA